MDIEYLILVVLFSFLFTPWFCLHRCARKEGLVGRAASAACTGVAAAWANRWAILRYFLRCPGATFGTVMACMRWHRYRKAHRHRTRVIAVQAFKPRPVSRVLAEGGEQGFARYHEAMVRDRRLRREAARGDDDDDADDDDFARKKHRRRHGPAGVVPARVLNPTRRIIVRSMVQL